MIPTVSTTDDKLFLSRTSHSYELRPEYCLYDQIRMFHNTLHYGYWVSPFFDRKSHITFGGWWKFGPMDNLSLVINPDTIEVWLDKWASYLTLENSAHNLNLLRAYT